MLKKLNLNLTSDGVAISAPEVRKSDNCRFDLPVERYWTLDYDGESILQLAETGPASIQGKTLPEILEEAVKTSGDKVFLRRENVCGNLGKDVQIPEALPLAEWQTKTYGEFLNEVRNVAKAMISCDFRQHDAGVIFGFNSPEWFVAFYAAVFAGGKGTGIYSTDNAQQVQYKSDHSNSSIAFVETKANLEKYKSKINELPYLKTIVTWGTDPGDDIKTADGRIVNTYSYADFIELGKRQTNYALEDRLESIKGKSIILGADVMGGFGDKNEEERMISYLPLSHIAGMLIDMVNPVFITAMKKAWITICFARPYDLKRGSLGDRLKAVRPTLFFGVPRVWEKMMEKLKAVAANMPDSSMKRVIAAAKKTRLEYEKNHQLGGSGETSISLYAYNILLSQIKAKLGLDRAKVICSGSAPMSLECHEYFAGIGLPILEGFGMSEGTALTTWSSSKHHVWGSVGYPLPGVELKIFQIDPVSGKKKECPPAADILHPSEEEQGEICYRGRGNMMGYMANERLGENHVEEIERKNMDAIDSEGWLHSGDKGAKGSNGMLRVTGRYKELIIGAGGENVAPVPIEDELKKVCPIISNVVMIGNKRKFNVCLITLKAVDATGEFPGTNQLDGVAKSLSSSKTIEEAIKDPIFVQVITDAINKVNANEDVCPSNAAKIQKFSILPLDFSIITGELTATLKLKRSLIDEKYQSIIDRMYSEVSDVYVSSNLSTDTDSHYDKINTKGHKSKPIENESFEAIVDSESPTIPPKFKWKREGHGNWVKVRIL